MAEESGAWPARVADHKLTDLVFIDELGANTKMDRTHGRAAPGLFEAIGAALATVAGTEAAACAGSWVCATG